MKIKIAFSIFLIIFVLSSCKKEQVATVSTADITEITTISAKCGGDVTDDGNSFVFQRGICWNTSPNPTIDNLHSADGNGSGSYTSTLSGLIEGVTYYVRAYAINDIGITYGTEKSFTTTTTALSINDFIGIYNVNAYNWDSQEWESWSGVEILSYTNSTTNTTWIRVKGIMFGANYAYFSAFGEFDQNNNCIRLYSGYGSTQTFYFNSSPDVNYNAYFYPIYALNNQDSFNYIQSGGNNGKGEAWLRMGSTGTLTLGASVTADNNGQFANGFTLIYNNSETNEYSGRFSIYTNVTFTKTSNKITNKDANIFELNKKQRLPDNEQRHNFSSKQIQKTNIRLD